MLDRYLAGQPAAALANEFGIHFGTVYSFVRRAGVPTRYRILSDDDIVVARKMYDTGRSLAVIGEHFGVADRKAPARWSVLQGSSAVAAQ